MTFGDWVLFNNWIRIKREEERYDVFLCVNFNYSICKNHFFSQTQAFNRYQNESMTGPSYRSNNFPVNSMNENRVRFDRNFLGTTINQLLSNGTQHSYINSGEEVYAVDADNLTVISAPKNVKFLIPLARSGLTSNESTFGVNEHDNRVIKNVRDIFSFESKNSELHPEKESVSTPPTILELSESHSFIEETNPDPTEMIENYREDSPLLGDPKSNK